MGSRFLEETMGSDGLLQVGAGLFLFLGMASETDGTGLGFRSIFVFRKGVGIFSEWRGAGLFLFLGMPSVFGKRCGEVETEKHMRRMY